MAVVRGRTLRDVLQATPSRKGHALRRLVGLFARAVDAVAYAHDQGVIHRDLKPRNIMVGPFGTVFVLDWGLVRFNKPEGAPVTPTAAAGATQHGSVMGTPGYLSPEQARGEPLTPASDVYALGLVLFELVTGRPAFAPGHARKAIDAARAGASPDVEDGPEALRAVLAKAIAPRPADRFPNAGALGQAVTGWLDGEAQRARALELVAQAHALEEEERRLAAEGQAMAQRAAAALAQIPSSAPPQAKIEAWATEDRGRDRMAQAQALQLQRLQALHGALTHDPECGEALAALAGHWHREHQQAEHVRNAASAAEARAQLAHYDRGHHAAYLEGRGGLDLRTQRHGSPCDGVEVTLYRFVPRERRLVPEEPRTLATPIVDLSLPNGKLPGGGACRARPASSHLDRKKPEMGSRRRAGRRGSRSGRDLLLCGGGPVLVGGAGDGPSDAAVGPALAGGLRGANAPRHARSVSGVHQRPCRSRPPRGRRTTRPQRTWRARSTGCLVLRTERRRPLSPRPRCGWRSVESAVAGISRRLRGGASVRPLVRPAHGAAVAAPPRARAREGRPRRRWAAVPWGDHFDPAFACVRASHVGRPLPAPVDAYPWDCSVYGIRGLAGNMRDWCSDAFVVDPTAGNRNPPQVLRGGCWYFSDNGSHAAARFGLDPHNRGDTVGFRLVRSIRGEIP